MAGSKAQRLMLWAGAVVVVLLLAAGGGWLYVMHEMKARVIEALGPLGSVEDVDAGYARITLSRVRMRGPQGWPADDALRAERVTLNIDMRSVLTSTLHLRNITVDGFYLSVARFADGRVDLLPNLKQSTREAQASSTEAARHAREERLIDHVTFERGAMEFFDESVQKPPYRILISNAHATVDDLHLPALTNPTKLDMTGSIKGPSHTGTVAFNGWMKIASKDSQTHTTLRNVDIATLDPYLLKKVGARSTVTGGTIDLTLDATVQNYTIHAPGSVVLNHLQLSENGNPLDTFLSIPTKVAIAALKNHDQIKLDFELDGNLRDPKFSLNESLTKKLAVGFAKALGVNAEGAARNASGVVKSIGDALKNLFSK
ncbi:DUF748 domain-containing protein [Caballeronia sp. DA-9]|uniref:DUF748 domain-containing protein n=1 Tax=Caballeronia sp. DA-9 TaxID=3436237 RepID=UPI003F6733C0